MPRFLPVFLLLFFTISLSAQFDKGSWMLSLAMSFSQNNFSFREGIGENLVTDFRVGIGAGRFIFKGTALGLEASYFRIEEPNQGHLSFYQNISARYFARQYFNLGNDQFFLIGEGQSIWVDESDWAVNVDETNASFWFVGAGLNHFLGDNVALETTLKWRLGDRHIEQFPKLELGLGLQFFLNKNKTEIGWDSLTTRYLRKGNALFGGEFKFGIGKDVSDIRILPSIRYFITNRMEAEFQPYFIQYPEGYHRNIGFRMELRRYFFFKERVAFLPSVKLGYGLWEVKFPHFGQKRNTRILHTGFGSQLWFFLSSRLILKLGYLMDLNYSWAERVEGRPIIINEAYSNGINGKVRMGVEYFLSQRVTINLNLFLENFQYEVQDRETREWKGKRSDIITTNFQFRYFLWAKED